MTRDFTSELTEILSCWNHTELYQAARAAGVPVRPGLSREQLIECLLGTTTTLHHNPIDAWRQGLIGFILSYWSKLRTLLTCPATELEGHATTDTVPKTIACWACLDQQVMACLVDNHQREHLIELHRKRY